MTVIASASGVRIDCDACGYHTTATASPLERLRFESGFVLHAGRDWCPDCWTGHGLAGLAGRDGGADDDGPAAA
jgi:hypothetical protein